MLLMRKSILLFVLGMSAIPLCFANEMETDPASSIDNTDTTIIGINHIGLSVPNLDDALRFYQDATGYEVLERKSIKGDKVASKLFGVPNVEYETATLNAPNMLLEITAFKRNKDTPIKRSPLYSQRMSHTCYQSPHNNPAYPGFIEAGADVVAQDDELVYSTKYGVSYIYAHDPFGNLLELEMLKGGTLEQADYNGVWRSSKQNIWMSQASFFTHDRDRLLSFYQKVLNIKPTRRVVIANSPRADTLIDHENSHFLAGWFSLNRKSKVIEIVQFVNPKTEPQSITRKVTDLGYSFSFEVEDINKEYQRLTSLGVEFISEPMAWGAFIQVFAKDADNNIFSLRQATGKQSHYSIRHFDPPISTMAAPGGSL